MLVEDNELNAEVAEILLEDEGAIITMVNEDSRLSNYLIIIRWVHLMQYLWIL